ncbi:DsbA family protein [Parasphingorhabdus sp.]|uniref:DsbA family protein n=1 Tax=Parasphingorhabdus sp. TaxID=2709688 RepID=UPI003263BA1A
MLTAYIDFRSPASYLAIKPVLALAKRHGITVQWQPFRTFERDIPDVTESPTVAQSHRRVRATSRRAIHQKYAAHQGIDLQFPDPAGNTDLALGALALIKGDPLPFIHATFAAYWTSHADLNNPDIVAPLLMKTLAEDLRFDQNAAIEALESTQEDAEERGVVDAPAFIIQDQLFIGREHLPWIEELIVTET